MGGVIEAERRRWRAPEKLRRIAAIVPLLLSVSLVHLVRAPRRRISSSKLSTWPVSAPAVATSEMSGEGTSDENLPGGRRNSWRERPYTEQAGQKRVPELRASVTLTH